MRPPERGDSRLKEHNENDVYFQISYYDSDINPLCEQQATSAIFVRLFS
jgi:hypothetical protein